ncbi:MAG: hypothetical protein EOP40_11780 [Rubrivivax sp.]|nr:MAG: hypothetical protein EOP40_11780 [Rubrivivax sp.]
MALSPPIVWSIAGLDTAGGAGLSADQRAADALGVHLCPVVACLTAQHSCGVQATQPIDGAWLEAQLRALAHDLPPHAIKTGLLGSVEAVKLVARWVDRLRAAHPERTIALVVDPVFGATAGGVALSNDDLIEAYERHLLPRATLLTPNRAEARRLLGQPARHDGSRDTLPDLAAELRRLGATGVSITGGDADPGEAHCQDWIDTPQAQGWLSAPRVATRHHHGTGCTFAMGAAAALALGHSVADALVLAKMLTHHALTGGHAAGQGAGPVTARTGFAAGPAQGGAPLPWLGLGREAPWRLTHAAPDMAATASTAPVALPPLFLPSALPDDGLYGIVATGDRVQDAIAAGLQCVQLRHKAHADLAEHLATSMAAASRAGITLFINDHWRETLQALPDLVAPVKGQPARIGVHLGQEDLLALSLTERHELLAARHRLALGLSSHSLWELARAAGCGASVIACGPVQATTTKDMPWHPQGEHNLRWWVAHSPVPVLGIGGLLTPADVARFAACGPAALCVVRGLGDSGAAMGQAVPPLKAAVARGRRAQAVGPPALPQPVL